MGTFLFALGAVVLFFCLVAILPLVLLWQKKKGPTLSVPQSPSGQPPQATAQAIHGHPPAQAGGGVVVGNTHWYDISPTALWVIGIVAGIGLGAYFLLTGDATGSVGKWIFLAFVLGLSILLIVKGGTFGKWVGIPLFILTVIFGPHVFTVMVKYYGTVEDVLEGKVALTEPTRAEARSSAPMAPAMPSWVGVIHTIEVNSTEWSQPILNMSDRCLRSWGVDPDGKAFITEQRGINHETWYEVKRWWELREQGLLPYRNPGWTRFKATGENAKVMYTFLPLSQCPYR